MTVRKIAVSLAPELATAIREDADATGTSVSGWIADAAARKLRRKFAREALAEFEAAHGPITAAEAEEARRRWPG